MLMVLEAISRVINSTSSVKLPNSADSSRFSLAPTPRLILLLLFSLVVLKFDMLRFSVARFVARLAIKQSPLEACFVEIDYKFFLVAKHAPINTILIAFPALSKT